MNPFGAIDAITRTALQDENSAAAAAAPQNYPLRLP